MLDAGSVEATLGGRFNPAGFLAFDRAMKESGTHTTGFEKALLRTTSRGGTALRALGTAAGFGAAGGVAALGVAIVGTVKKAADFEGQLSALKSVTEANGKQMALFRAQALKAGADTKYSALQAAQAQTELAKGGLSVSQIMRGGLRAALSLAAAGDLELADAATFTVNAMKLFGLQGKESMHVADALATAANATTADVKDFGMALTQGGTAAKAAGLDFNNTVVALEALASIGVKNSDAGTSLKTALTQLASPTKKSAGLMKELGLDFFDAHGKIKDVVDISAMLRDKLGGLTKEQRLQTVTTLAGTDGQRALLALYDQGPKKLQAYEDGLKKQGTAAKVAAEKQDNLKGKIENLKGSIETSAIIIGSALIPQLTHGAEKLTDFLNAAAKRGDIKKVGEDLAHGMQTAAGAIPTVIDGIQLIAHVIGATVHEVEALVNAFGGIETVGPLLLGVGAGLVALRVAQAVVPSLIGVATALNDIALASRAGGLAFAAETVVSMVNPATAATVAFAGLGAAIVYLISRESEEEQIAKRVAAAKRDQANATKELTSVENAGADATIAAQQAHLRLGDAHKAVAQALKENGRNSHEYRTALTNERRAGLDWVEAHKRMIDERKKLDDKQRNESVPSTNRLVDATKELDKAQTRLDVARKTGGPGDVAYAEKKLAEAQREETAASKAATQATDRGAISKVNYQRALQGLGPIAKKNQADISLLTDVLNEVPAKKRTKLEADDQDVLAKLGRTVPKLMAYGKLKQAAKILADSANAEEALRRVKALLDSIQSKTVNVQINEHHGGGGGAFNLNVPAKKKARGGRLDGPEVMVAGEAGREYVIPVEAPYRGRGIELWLQAGRDLGVGMFGKGKAPKKKAKQHRNVPAHRDPLSLPVDTFQTDERNAQQRYDDAVRRVHDLEHQTGLKGKSYAAERAKARKALPGARKMRDALEKKLKAREDELHSAKVFAGKISRQEDLAEIARNAMELADKQDDQGAYDKAKGKRTSALGALKGLYEQALQHVRNDTPYGRTLLKALGQAKLDIQDVATATNDPETTPDAPTLLTKEQQARLDDLDKAAALAELTPDDLTDDKAALTDLVSFRETVLAELQSGGGSSAFIAEAARDVKSARDQLSSLTSSPGGGGNDPDLQAQIAQANRRAGIAEERARIADAAVDTFRRSGDINYGLAPQITIQTLHPADPATLDAIGQAATAGIGLQGSVGSSRLVTGF